MELKETLARLKSEALDALESADVGALDALRVRYLGKKGEITAILKQMGGLSPEERPVIGQLANEVRAELERTIDEKSKELAAKALELRLKAEAVDVTVPGKTQKLGKKHPLLLAKRIA